MSKSSGLIFENDKFIVVCKPAGENFHDEEIACSGFFNQWKRVYPELYPVHRLDKMTSGLMLMAKDSNTASQLSALFAERNVSKLYIALACGKPKKKQGIIKGDMVKSRRGTFKLERTTNNPAITHFQSFSLEPGLRLYKLMPKTGKTHQLRVAMNSLGTAILGDPNYSFTKTDSAIADRGYLHAYRLSFTLDGHPYDFEADLAMVEGKMFNLHSKTITELLNPI